MFARVFFVLLISHLVFARNVEHDDGRPSLTTNKSNVNAEQVKIDSRRAVNVPAVTEHEIIWSVENATHKNHGLIHTGTAHPHKRTANDKTGNQAEPEPGCCG